MLADWMYWVTAIVFTSVGFFIGIESGKKVIVALTIEQLIKDGYIKTRGLGKDKEIVKYDEQV